MELSAQPWMLMVGGKEEVRVVRTEMPLKEGGDFACQRGDCQMLCVEIVLWDFG